MDKVKDEQGNTFLEISRRAWLIACCAVIGLFFILASYFFHLYTVSGWVRDLRASLEKDLAEMETSNYHLEAKITSSTPVLSRKVFAETLRMHEGPLHFSTQNRALSILAVDWNTVTVMFPDSTIKTIPDSVFLADSDVNAFNKDRDKLKKNREFLRLSQTVGIGIILFTLIGASVILVLRVLIYIFPSMRAILPLYATKLLQVFFGKSA